MITGYNTDVKFNGKTYHVQTEDRGSGNPIIESLVYVAGRILDSIKTPYTLKDGFTEAQLAEMLEGQHKRILRGIKNGRYDPEGIKPFGHGIISDRGFEEVVLEFIQDQVKQEKVELQVEELGELSPGWTGALRIQVRTDILLRPQEGCPVRITTQAPDADKPKRLFQGKTDGKGTVLAEITLPDRPASGELIIVAEAEAGEVETRLRYGAH